MIRRLLFLIVASALASQSAYSQGSGSDSPTTLKTGEQIQISDSVTLKVTRAAKSPFTDVKLRGQAVVVVLDLDAGKKNATISYQLSANPKLTEIYLTGGPQKIAPIAVVEDFASWGADNDKEIEVLDPTEKSGGVNLSFARKGTVSLLFDVPADQAGTPQKLSIKLRTIAPTEEQRSFVVTL